MKILVNALSVNNSSGRHVLKGHLSRLSRRSLGRHDYIVLHHRWNDDLRTIEGDNISWVRCPDASGHWLLRSAWERHAIPRLSMRTGTDLVLSLSGMITPGVRSKQVTYAQNPWALVRGIPRNPVDRMKSHLQRRLYRDAVLHADAIMFLSGYMREAYRQNAKAEEKNSRVVYSGVDEDTFSAAAEAKKKVVKNRTNILAVSEMAPHKEIETLVTALSLIRKNSVPAATLSLVGRWSLPAYESRIRRLVSEMGLADVVEFAGFVTKEGLHRRYAAAGVFSLMSRCESFGIPAVEAQAFGTPVVSSNCCAIPEVCGDGGVFPEAGDAQAVAREIGRVMTDDAWWHELSESAAENAQRFRWDACAQPMLELFSEVVPGKRK